MESQLSLSAIQTDLFWEDKAKNLQQLAEPIEALPTTDIIILPEMFTTGFTMAAEKFAESMQGETVEWLRYWAYEKNRWLLEEVPSLKKAIPFTTSHTPVVDPSGEVQYYDKRHTFTHSWRKQSLCNR